MPHPSPRRRLIRRARIQRISTFLCLLVLIPFQLLCSAIPLKTYAMTSVIIEEITWAGSSKSTADEWIELANLSDTPAAIGAWTIKGAGTSDKDIVLPGDAVIPPNGTYVIANYAESDEKSALNSTVQLATTTVSLSNTQITIQLFDANQTLIDQAGNGNAPFAGTATPVASMIRTDALTSGEQSSVWNTATSSFGFKEGVSDLGTPGFCDLCRQNTSSESIPVEATPRVASTPSDVSTSTVTSTTQTTSTVTSTLSLSLNEIISNPASGLEWIELIADMDATSTDRELLLYDAQNKIATIATGTIVTAPPYLIIQLPSAKLNNGGDSLTLKESDGTIIESLSIPSLEKNQSYAKNPETDAWETTDTITPASENIIYHTPSPVRVTPRVAQTSTSSVASTSSASSSTSTIQTKSDASGTTAPAVATAVPTHYAPVFLNEIVSNPSSGPEWVEIYTTSTATSTDRVLILHDSKSAIKIIPINTPFTLPHYLVIPLSGSKLTNSGEALSLTDASGTVLDATTIPKLAKGESWIKTLDGIWSITTTLTPSAENQSANATETSSQLNDDSSTASSQEIITSSEDALDDIFTASEESNSAQPLKKSTAFKTTDTLTSHDFSDMFDESLNGIRARIIGSVASVPKLFGASHVFILQNEDGKGLIVYVPTQLHIPPFGSTVRVDGTLALTEYGPQFKMKKTDIWMTMATTTPPQSRTVDLLAPGTEDAWSLVTIRGTVTAIGTTSVTIETEDAISVTVSAPTAAGFRTKRLVKGDLIQATGLLNIKKMTPTIIIRTPQDVALVKHAEATLTKPESSATAQSNNKFPNWAPFASAGAAIVATGGAKRLKEEMRKRTLKKLMEEGRKSGHGNRDTGIER